MAQPIQDPTVGSALQRLFNLQGRVRPALEEFIIPTVQVAALEGHAPPPVTGLASCTAYVAATAGEYATLRFEVPGGILAELLEINVTAAADGSLSLANRGNAATVAGLAGTATKGYLDGRLLPGSTFQGNPAGVLTYGTQAALIIGTPWIVRLQNGVPRTFALPRGLVLGTGVSGAYGFLELQFNVANAALTRCSLIWREYAIS